MDASENRFNNVIVTITDKTFFAAVYVLLLSIKYHRVKAKINILCVGLGPEEKAYLGQFDGVELFDADLSNTRNPSTRKAEALLTAEKDRVEYVTLLDGDGLVMGDITPYISPGKVLSTRVKSDEEDASVFASRYEPGEKRGAIPEKMLRIWQRDVGERETARLTNSIASGNLTIHTEFFDFVRKWHAQMMKVLPSVDKGSSRDFDSCAYFQLDESVLESLLAFAHGAPPVAPGLLNQDPSAYVAHLGPHPKPWKLLCTRKLKYYGPITEFVDWARREGYEVPKLPWTFKKSNAVFVYASAYAYFSYETFRDAARNLLGPRRRFD